MQLARNEAEGYSLTMQVNPECRNEGQLSDSVIALVLACPSRPGGDAANLRTDWWLFDYSRTSGS